MTNPACLVKVHSTTAMKTAIDAIAPAFERETACKLAIQFGPSGRMARLVGDGDPTDVAIVTGGGIDDLIARGRILAGSRCDIARSMVGVAVPRGAPRPDLSTVAGFLLALRSARSIAMSNPAGGAQSGAHLAKVFDQLGIADEMKAKSIYGPGGPAGLVGNFLLRGEADLGLQQLPELRAVPGIDVVGPLPAEIGLLTVFSAGIATAAANVEAARAWIAHLKSTPAREAIEAAGMTAC